MARIAGGGPRLESRLAVGSVTVRNRVVFAAHLTNFAVDGLPTERHAAYYAARAAGGAGLVITEEHTVHPGDRPYEKLIRGFDPAVLPGYRRLTDAVHAHGVPVLAQLNHNGGQSFGGYTRRPVWAPSAVPDRLFREVPVALTTAQITELISGYAEVAARCVAGGFDGVELQGSQSSLVRQFLDPATNRRTDSYGGSPAGRRRFLIELVAAVRAAIGPDRVLGVRLGCDDLPGVRPGGLPGGAGPPGDLELPAGAEVVEVAMAVAGTGQLDYVNTAIGVAGSTQYRITPPMGVPAGYALALPMAIRAALRAGLGAAAPPVLGVGRFTTPEQVREALDGGACDLVGVVRGQVADPEFAGRAVRGEPVRTCLGCNQECVGRVGRNRWLGCVRNPSAGRERSVAPGSAVQSAPGREPPTGRVPVNLTLGGRSGGSRVLVVGGGPAGLRAAATAAARGHRVTLCERAEVAGGQVRLAARAPGRAEFGQVVDELLAECSELGVVVRTGVAVDAAFVRHFEPDELVLATGSRPAPPEWAVPGVYDVRQVLSGEVEPAGPVLVYDELGHQPAASVAVLLAARGCAVELLTPAMVVVQDLGLTLDRERFRRRAHELGIRQSTDRVVLGVTRTGPGADSSAGPGGERLAVDVLHHPTGARERRECAEVVCVVAAEPADELWRGMGAELGRAGRAVYRVGDCLAPRRLDAAIIEGDRAGRAVGEAR
ncbi:MAG TPA: mycofactocin system FadH/OYE family oxidoreductase 2 [Pseudonocardia sp.]|nr:mycofactocin system FadH/OYE family oxidoreductase 2 [Pseudonocardia sp.]